MLVQCPCEDRDQFSGGEQDSAGYTMSYQLVIRIENGLS